MLETAAGPREASWNAGKRQILVLGAWGNWPCVSGHISNFFRNSTVFEDKKSGAVDVKQKGVHPLVWNVFSELKITQPGCFQNVKIRLGLMDR